MILPKILPDELLAGYRGRIAAFNGLRTPKEVALALRDPDGSGLGANNQTLAFIDAAATLNGITAEELLQRHSCIALYGAIRKKQEHDHINERVLSGFRSLALFNPGKRLRACPECIAGDRRERSIAYWRRSHQVPGRFACATHGCTLWTTIEPALTPAGPDDVAEYSHSFDAVTCQRLRSNEYVARALFFMDTMIQESLVFDRKTCSQALQLVLDSEYKSASKLGRMLALSIAIKDAFTIEWLRFTMPGQSLSSEYALNLVKSCRFPKWGHSSYVSMAIIESMLLPSSEEALTKMSGMPVRAATCEAEAARIDKSPSAPYPATNCINAL